jgi:hypothetical protein
VSDTAGEEILEVHPAAAVSRIIARVAVKGWGFRINCLNRKFARNLQRYHVTFPAVGQATEAWDFIVAGKDT